MSKKKKNANYITKKSVANAEAAKVKAEKARKTKKALIISGIALGVLLAIFLSVLFIGFAKGWWGKYKPTHKAEIVIENYGTIELELYGDLAPKTVENFVKLANEGFYDGLTFHRIIEGFMMQGGDPKGNGSGGSGTDIVGEFKSNGYSRNTLKHKRGVISMARSEEPNSASSQFFIMHKDYPSLNGEYAAFGRVTSGMDVVDKICTEADPYDSKGNIVSTEQPRIVSIRIK